MDVADDSREPTIISPANNLEDIVTTQDSFKPAQVEQGQLLLDEKKSLVKSDVGVKKKGYSRLNIKPSLTGKFKKAKHKLFVNFLEESLRTGGKNIADDRLLDNPKSIHLQLTPELCGGDAFPLVDQ